MVIDMIFQDKYYPRFAPKVRAGYKGNLRVILFWVLTPLLCAIVISVIVVDLIEWDNYGNSFTSTSELTRGLLASMITLWDLLIVMQDWEFPTFETNQDINLPGRTFYSFLLQAC